MNTKSSLYVKTRWSSMVVACVLCTLPSVGCSSREEPFRKPTTGVTGQVLVDGAPVPVTEPLKVECQSLAGIDQEHPTFSSCLTGEDGKFSISTYESGDGVPAGDYVLTFMWGKMNLISASYSGPDRLDGKYSDPKLSQHKFTAKEGEPVELGRIELTTK